jgi:two-component system phosphate regulon sensor histidine kinase PhoR
MQPDDDNQVTLSLRELGFSKLALVVATVSVGVLPAALGLYFEVSLLSAVGIAGGGLAAASIAIFLGARHLRRTLLDPLDELAHAMDQLRSSGRAPRISEAGAPLVQPMMRQFNLAGMALEQRSRQSLANLMSVEAAFDRVHAVLQSLSEGVIVVDPAGKIVLANRNARRMLVFGEGPVEGETLLSKLDGELRTTLAAGLDRVDGSKVGEQHTADVPHGERIVDVSIVQVQSNRPDQDFGKVVVFADVTRNHELKRLKDELLSSISHELITPLTNMRSASEILATLTPENEAEWREFTDILNSESRRLESLVNDVLEFSMLESGQIVLTLENADVAAIVDAAVAKVRAAALRKHLQLTVEADRMALATIDRNRFEEVLRRVLDNAIKFSPDGGSVQVTVRQHDDLVDVAVADSGPGIPEADRLRVFERFFQGGNVMTDKPQGAGLGLSIAQRLIDAMQGTIWCEESQLGGALIRLVVRHASQPAAAGAHDTGR